MNPINIQESDSDQALAQVAALPSSFWQRQTLKIQEGIAKRHLLVKSNWHDLRTNLIFRIFVYIFLGLQVVDVVTTIQGLSYGATEMNSFMRHWYLLFGPSGLIGAKVVLSALVLTLILYFKPRSRYFILTAAILLMIIVVYNNFQVIALTAGLS